MAEEAREELSQILEELNASKKLCKDKDALLQDQDALLQVHFDVCNCILFFLIVSG
jgi:hypothetical protein